MAADLATVKNRVTEILNACTGGTFSSTVDSNYLDRNATAIAEAVREAALMIGKAIIANPRHGHRNLFVSDTATTLTHMGELPDMSAEMDLVEIQLYSGAGWTTGTPRTVEQIESFRLNPSNVYGTAHTTQNSPLAGYYAIKNGRVYFTGYAARGYFPLLDRTTITGLIPDEYEDCWVANSVPLCMKEGDNLQPVAAMYAQIGQQQLAAVTSMGIIQPMPSVAEARAARGDS